MFVKADAAQGQANKYDRNGEPVGSKHNRRTSELPGKLIEIVETSKLY